MGDWQAVGRGQPPPFFLSSPLLTAAALGNAGRFLNRERWSRRAADGNLVASSCSPDHYLSWMVSAELHKLRQRTCFILFYTLISRCLRLMPSVKYRNEYRREKQHIDHCLLNILTKCCKWSFTHALNPCTYITMDQ